MFRIAICDEDTSFQKLLLDYIAKDADIDDDYVTECFDSYTEVKKRLDDKKFSFDILFLMVDESGKGSMSLVQYIREKKIDVDVFFVANNAEHVTEAFHCKAFNYIVKPLE